jgi:hypothetical protein
MLQVLDVDRISLDALKKDVRVTSERGHIFSGNPSEWQNQAQAFSEMIAVAEEYSSKHPAEPGPQVGALFH